MSIFRSPSGSAVSSVSLKPWNPQFSEGKTNGWHSAVGSDEHGMLRVVHESGPSLAIQIRLRSDHSALFGALQIVQKNILFRDLSAQSDPLVVRRVGYIHFVAIFSENDRFVSFPT